mmetsp:Transcript_1099/g.3330  ORF Transcript_1099/g.3330 Transcript_1099/m.3330 type:complete len:214 (+) Transcript_1099:164-805(+)
MQHHVVAHVPKRVRRDFADRGFLDERVVLGALQLDGGAALLGCPFNLIARGEDVCLEPCVIFGPQILEGRRENVLELGARDRRRLHAVVAQRVARVNRLHAQILQQLVPVVDPFAVFPVSFEAALDESVSDLARAVAQVALLQETVERLVVMSDVALQFLDRHAFDLVVRRRLAVEAELFLKRRRLRVLELEGRVARRVSWRRVRRVLLFPKH